MTIVDLTVAVHDALDDHEIDHAFGGALALGYIVEPRATVDIDVNAFVDGLTPVLEALAPLGLAPEEGLADRPPIAGTRLRDEASGVVDLFPSLDEAYTEIAGRCVTRPFGPEERLLPFLSPEDLCVFKLSFGRDKDWVDLRNIAEQAITLDLDIIEDTVVALRGDAIRPRMARLRALRRGRQ